MLYWLIPYLVAYNASNSGEWKYGPEHVFNAEIYSNVTFLNDDGCRCSDTNIEFSCRPMNSSLIQCRVNSGTMEKYQLIGDEKVRLGELYRMNLEIENSVFQVAFNESGITKIWFPNSKDNRIDNQIRAIIGTMHWGMSIVEKKFEKYESLESSIIGTCQTQFDIRKKSPLEYGENNNETVLQEYNFVVPPLTERTHNDMIVIEKNRDMKDCVKKTPYLFDDIKFPIKIVNGRYFQLATSNTHSRSWMYIGRKSFSAYTENIGMRLYTREVNTDLLEIKAGELIRVSLNAIRPAKDEISTSEKLEKIGVGFEPGTPWSEPNFEPRVKFFM